MYKNTTMTLPTIAMYLLVVWMLVGSAKGQQIGLGEKHSCAISQTGVVQCWGSNANGQGQLSPPSSLTFKHISTHSKKNCGILTNQSLYCWGDNTTSFFPPPKGSFLQVATGRQHSCAIRTNFSIVCWDGKNTNGENNPPSSGTFLQVVTGYAHACALRNDGQIFCWGNNLYNQIMSPPGVFVQITSGYHYNCAIRKDGKLICWGASKYYSNIPEGLYIQVHTSLYFTCAIKLDHSIVCFGDYLSAIIPSPIGKFIQVTVGTIQACAIQAENGAISCWGDNTDGEISTLAFYTQIATGDYHVCGILIGGSASCWGDNSNSQSIPPENSVFTQVSVGSSHSCGLRRDNSIVCWGNWANFQNLMMPPDGNFSQICSNENFNCAIRSNFSVVCWGRRVLLVTNGTFTQISCGSNFANAIATNGTIFTFPEISTNSNFTWVPSPSSEKFLQVCSGRNHVCALRNTSTIMCWGDNSFGQLNYPIGTFISISCRVDYNCAIRSDRTGVCWGDNGNYQSSIPSLSTYIQVSAGKYFSCAIRTDNTVICFGSRLDTPAYYIGALSRPGFYSLGTQELPCKSGTFSSSRGAISPICDGFCDAGRYSNITGATYFHTNSSCEDICPKGNYCPLGTALPIKCPAGSYGISQGLTSEMCTAPCPSGFYCPEETKDYSKYPCPAGYYGANSALKNSYCNGTCKPGYYCNTGSISATQTPCGKTKYCPEGSTDPRTPKDGYYATNGTDDTNNTNQTLCDAGSFCILGIRVLCEHASYSTAGQSHCAACPNGTYSDIIGATGCKLCPSGWFSPHSKSYRCLDCSPGKYGSYEGQSHCDECPLGMKNPFLNATSCITCEAGKYAGLSGSKYCIECEPGTYQSNPGSSSCELCRSGTYSYSRQSTACIVCEVGTFQPLNASRECISCPDGSYNFATKQTSCLECSSGLDCGHGTARIKEGYWGYHAADGTVLTIECITSNCKGTQIPNSVNALQSLIQCDSDRDEASDNYLCGRCKQGYREWGGKCTDCSKTRGEYIFLLLVCAWVFIILLTLLSKKRAGTTAIIIYFVQTAYLMVSRSTAYFQWFGFFNFESQASYVKVCVADLSPTEQFLLGLFTPILFCLLLVITGMFHYFISNLRCKRIQWMTTAWEFELPTYVKAGTSLFLFSYTSITNNVLRWMNCIPVKDDMHVIYSIPAVECTSQSYKAIFAFCVIIFFIYVIGLPIAIFVFLVNASPELLGYKIIQKDRPSVSLTHPRAGLIARKSITMPNTSLKNEPHFTLPEQAIHSIHCNNHQNNNITPIDHTSTESSNYAESNQSPASISSSFSQDRGIFNMNTPTQTKSSLPSPSVSRNSNTSPIDFSFSSSPISSIKEGHEKRRKTKNKESIVVYVSATEMTRTQKQKKRTNEQKNLKQSRLNLIYGKSFFLVIIRFLGEPYRYSTRWWNSVIMIRRSCIVAATLIFSSVSRSLVIAVLNILFVVIHALFLPYRPNKLNFYEGISLFFLSLLSTLLASYTYPFPRIVTLLIQSIVIIPSLFLIIMLIWDKVGDKLKNPLRPNVNGLSPKPNNDLASN